MTFSSMVPIETITDGTPVTYGVVKPGPEDEHGVKFIRGGDVVAGKINIPELRTITDSVSQQYKRTLLKGGELLVSLVGNPGEVAVVPDELAGSNIARQVGLIRLDTERFNPWFVQYYLMSPQGKAQLFAYSLGSVQKVINLKELKRVEIPNINIETQNNIVKILKDIDDKIELNRQINQTLEQIAQAIFKSWFVDFEPVKAKIEAKQNGQDPERAAMRAISGKTDEELDQLSADQLQQLTTAAALFPDNLVDSELGEIPKEWKPGSMKDCCLRVESGGTPKRSEDSYWNGNIRWLSSGEVRDVIILDTKEKISEEGLNNSSAKLWPTGSTVVAMYGATAGQICLLANEMTANQACCALIPMTNFRSYIFLSARRSIEELAGKASGSAQQNLNKSLVADHKVLLPEEKILEVFERMTQHLLDSWIKNTEQNVVLAELRDTLLPKLLSGEFAIGDTQSTAEAVA